MDDTAFLARAIEISRRALTEPGLRPFGAVVVKDGRIVGEGVNQADAKADPTSHGEIEAIRDACARLGTWDLTGTALYTSCEPCPMCVATMHIARIERVVYAASAQDSREVFAAGGRPGVSASLDLPRQVAMPIHERRMPASQALRDESVAVLQAFANG